MKKQPEIFPKFRLSKYLLENIKSYFDDMYYAKCPKWGQPFISVH